jgi:hypothetical protein
MLERAVEGQTGVVIDCLPVTLPVVPALARRVPVQLCVHATPAVLAEDFGGHSSMPGLGSVLSGLHRSGRVVLTAASRLEANEHERVLGLPPGALAPCPKGCACRWTTPRRRPVRSTRWRSSAGSSMSSSRTSSLPPSSWPRVARREATSFSTCTARARRRRRRSRCSRRPFRPQRGGFTAPRTGRSRSCGAPTWSSAEVAPASRRYRSGGGWRSPGRWAEGTRSSSGSATEGTRTRNTHEERDSSDGSRPGWANSGLR